MITKGEFDTKENWQVFKFSHKVETINPEINVVEGMTMDNPERHSYVSITQTIPADCSAIKIGGDYLFKIGEWGKCGPESLSEPSENDILSVAELNETSSQTVSTHLMMPFTVLTADGRIFYNFEKADRASELKDSESRINSFICLLLESYSPYKNPVAELISPSKG